MSTEVRITAPRVCDVHLARGMEVQATVDGKTVLGPWANMCTECHERYGVGLGTGRGQRLILEASDG